jgi:sec-independent protein translocase protein TatA
MNVGPPELLIVLIIILVLFGASRLPKLARSLGEASNEFKAGLKEGGKPGAVAGPCPFCETEVPEDAKFCPGCSKSAAEIVAARGQESSSSSSKSDG